MNIDCLASGLDRTIFAGVKRGMADSMGAYCGDQGRGSLPVREQSLVPLTSMTEGATAHFLIPLLFPVNCSYLNP